MSLKVNFKIENNQDCGKLKFTDITCSYNPLLPATCCDGYGADENINKWEVGSTRFNWITPSGNTFTAVDLGFVPGISAKASFDVTGGTDGVVVVCVGGKEVGKAIFVTDIATLVEALVVDINSKNELTGWKAIFTGTVITVVNNSTGTEYNGLSLEVYVTDSMTVSVIDSTTSGGNDEDDSHYITMQNLYGSTTCPADENKFEAGIHTVVYVVYNSAEEEVSRQTLKVFIDCEVLNGLRSLTEYLMAQNCSCGNGVLGQRILLLRARYDAIKAMFCKGDYDCINEEMIELLDDINGACLDC